MASAIASTMALPMSSVAGRLQSTAKASAFARSRSAFSPPCNVLATKRPATRLVPNGLRSTPCWVVSDEDVSELAIEDGEVLTG